MDRVVKDVQLIAGLQRRAPQQLPRQSVTRVSAGVRSIEETNLVPIGVDFVRGARRTHAAGLSERRHLSVPALLGLLSGQRFRLGLDLLTVLVADHSRSATTACATAGLACAGTRLACARAGSVAEPFARKRLRQRRGRGELRALESGSVHAR